MLQQLIMIFILAFGYTGALHAMDNDNSGDLLKSDRKVNNINFTEDEHESKESKQDSTLPINVSQRRVLVDPAVVKLCVEYKYSGGTTIDKQKCPNAFARADILYVQWETADGVIDKINAEKKLNRYLVKFFSKMVENNKKRSAKYDHEEKKSSNNNIHQLNNDDFDSDDDDIAPDVEPDNDQDNVVNPIPTKPTYRPWSKTIGLSLCVTTIAGIIWWLSDKENRAALHNRASAVKDSILIKLGLVRGKLS